MVCSNKINKRETQSAISQLVKRVKELELECVSDFLEVSGLSESIYEEWSNLKKTHKKKVMKSKKFNKQKQAEYEAEEEIVVGLASLLNEKLIDLIKMLRK